VCIRLSAAAVVGKPDQDQVIASRLFEAILRATTPCVIAVTSHDIRLV
jgi:hypothetical protein